MSNNNVILYVIMYLPIMKVQSCRDFGANAIVRGDDIAQSKELAFEAMLLNTQPLSSMCSVTRVLHCRFEYQCFSMRLTVGE